MERTPGPGDYGREQLSKLSPEQLQKHYDDKVNKLVEGLTFRQEASGERHYLKSDKSRMLELMWYRWQDIQNEDGKLSPEQITQAKEEFRDIKEQFTELFGSDELPDEFRS